MPNPKEQQVEQKFDLQTHVRDKYGKLIKTNPYRRYCRGGEVYYERPVGSGNLWYENNEPAGRMIDNKVDRTAAHVEFTAPVSEDQKLVKAVLDTKAENEALRRELEALKAEAQATKKIEVPQTQQKDKKEVK